MERETAIKANELIKEINDLKEYKSILRDSGYRETNHFEYRLHYGDNCKVVKIKPKHTPKFIKVLEEVIVELEQELKDLK